MLLGKLRGTCRLGRCAFFFGLALLLDVIGLVLLLVGIFASLDFWDFLIYTGSLILAFSLLFWIAWWRSTGLFCPARDQPRCHLMEKQQTDALSLQHLL
ncbi:hypothetical protein AB1E18_014388 [Capra hircus]